MTLGWKIDELIDSGRYDGLTTGWNPPKNVMYSGRAREKISQLNRDVGGRDYHKVEDVENILFIQPEDPPEVREEKNELLQEWLYVTEDRINFLLQLKRKLSSKVCDLALKSTLEELRGASRQIRERLGGKGSLYRPSDDRQEDPFRREMAENLLKGLLRFLQKSARAEQAPVITADLKYLTAVILDKRTEYGEYICSTKDYLQYLKSIGLEVSWKICPDCRVEIAFSEFEFCLCCGRRLR